MDTVVVNRAGRLLLGKSAILTPVTQSDKFRIDATWYGYADFQPGTQVDEVNHFGRHNTRSGDVLQIRDETSMQIICQVQVVEIKSGQTSLFSNEELAELGFNSREAFEAEYKMGDRWMWFVRVMPISVFGSEEPPAQ